MRLPGLLGPLFILASIAQGADSPIQTNEFGTGSETVYNLSASDFVARYASFSSFYINDSGGAEAPFGTNGVSISAPVHLPSGALITSVTMYYFDTYLGNDVDAHLYRIDTAGNGTSIADLLSSGNGGLGSSTVTLNPGATVDNNTNHYELFATLPRDPMFPLASTRLIRIAIKYRRQVSPSPGTATFSDVPTSHPLFQFIEALAASGITAGCNLNPPQYCPDAPLTRAQMAVFLARGLGLHWAP